MFGEAKKLYDELDVINLECKMLGAGSPFFIFFMLPGLPGGLDGSALCSEAPILKEAVVVARSQALGQVSQWPCPFVAPSRC